MASPKADALRHPLKLTLSGMTRDILILASLFTALAATSKANLRPISEAHETPLTRFCGNVHPKHFEGGRPRSF